MRFSDYLKEQDSKQKGLLAVFVMVLIITIYIAYVNFLKGPEVPPTTIEELKPLNLNLEILDSEVFNKLKNN